MKRYLVNKDSASKMVHDLKYQKGSCHIDSIVDYDTFDSLSEIDRKRFPNNCGNCMRRR